MNSKCVEDVPWVCAGDQDHIGTVGKVHSCPDAAEEIAKHEARWAREQAAEVERVAEEELVGSGDDIGDSSSGGDGGAAAGGAGEEEVRRRAALAESGYGGATAPYGCLGLDPQATQSQIRKAYRKLSLAFHPDKNGGSREAELAFQDIAAAYEILGSPDSRAKFDDFGGQHNEAFDTFSEYMDHMVGPCDTIDSVTLFFC